MTQYNTMIIGKTYSWKGLSYHKTLFFKVLRRTNKFVEIVELCDDHTHTIRKHRVKIRTDERNNEYITCVLKDVVKYCDLPYRFIVIAGGESYEDNWWMKMEDGRWKMT
jgi:hypothetical protein